MSGEIRLQAATGLTVKALIVGVDGTVWNSSAMVAVSTLSDANWTISLIACTEQTTSDTTGTGLYLANWPGSLTLLALYTVVFFTGASPSPGDLSIGSQNDPTEYLAPSVWDEVISTSAHANAQTSGKRLRQITSIIIANNTVEVSNSPNINQIQLASSESSVDGTFDPGVVGIISGTGAGQSRLILEYEGSTRLATLNRDWKIAPDITSEYIILASEGGLHVNEGLAQGGGPSSITLNNLASDEDNIYNGQFAFLVSGPGQDQVGRITAYDGTSKVATITTTVNGWSIEPDDTTGYIMMPVLDDTPTILGNPVGASISVDIAAVQADLPVKITKIVALNNFTFVMVLSSDHITGATGLTVTAERSIDGAAFSACVNSVVEISDGVYKISLAASDLNGDTICLKFTATNADTRLITIVTQRT